MVTMRTGCVSLSSLSADPALALGVKARPCFAMSAPRSPMVAARGPFLEANPPLAAWHHMQSQGWPLRCSEVTSLTIPQAEQRRRTYEPPHAQSQLVARGLLCSLMRWQYRHWTWITPA